MTLESPLQVTCENGSSYQHLEYSPAVLQEIHRRATGQFLSLPRGGVEVGGVLYGVRGNGRIRILAQHELPIEYLTGPSFTLSPNDESELAALLAATPPNGPDEERLEVIGWWHSHTRTDVSLSEADLEVHRRFFADPGMIAMIIKPFKFDPPQIAIYSPNEDEYAALCTFLLPTARPLSKRNSGAPEQSAAPTAPPACIEISAAVINPCVAPEPAESVQVASAAGLQVIVAPERRQKRRYMLIAAGCSIFLATAGFAFWRPQRAHEPVRLEVNDTATGLIVHWNVGTRAMSDTTNAELLITDGPGEPRSLPLRADDLRSGTVTYVRKSERVDLRLRVRSRAGQVEEAVAHFIGTAPAQNVQLLPAQPSRPQERPPELSRVEQEVSRLNSELKRLRSLSPLPPPTAQKQAVASVSDRARLASAVIPQAPARSLRAPELVVSTPIHLQLPTPAVSVPVSSQVAIPPAPAAMRKRLSGRAIWTGHLERGATLAIDSRRPTMGDLTGHMPARECRIRVYTGELRESGLVVYTDSGSERVEPPSAANGWNLTTFRPDVRRARGLSVIEAPNKNNGWQRLIVRGERPVSVLVVDWEEVGNQ